MTLFSGEEISFDNENLEEIVLSEETINEKYIKGEYRIVTEQARYPLNTISSQIVNNKAYRLNPEFQRRHRWDNKKRSLLIESLIINIPIPPIFLYEYKFSSYEVMDGLQRLTAIAGFYDDEYRLEGLEYWPELNGKKYSELPENIQRGIDRRYLSSIILLTETGKTPEQAAFMKRIVFERLNSGGVALNHQEKRNANYEGAFNNLCIRLAEENEDFKNLWGISALAEEGDNSSAGIFSDSNRSKDIVVSMKDVEFVLRFFAYRQRDELQKSLSLERYLDFYLEQANSFDQEVMDELELLFNKTMKFTRDLLSDKALFLYRKRKDKQGDTWSWYQRPTLVAYEPLTYVLSQLLKSSDNIIKRKEEILKNLPQFYKDNYKYFEGRNTGVSDLQKRQELYLKFFEKYI